MSHPTFATGEQFEIVRGDSRAVITELAACLRLFEKNSVQLTETFGDDQIPPGAVGILLAPWPNRVDKAVWTLNGKEQRLDITELKRGHATHGLLRNAGYRKVEHSESAVSLEAGIFPQHGYPFHLTHRVRYELDNDGDLKVTQSLINHSAEAAPVALGAHPYLRLGSEDTSRLTLTVPGETYLITDETLIPRDKAAAAEGVDLRAGQEVDPLDMDCAYTDLVPAANGRVESTLSAPDGRSVTLWQDDTFPYTHVFVTDKYPGRAQAVAIEPMTAPANAFNSGDGLIWLESGAEFGGSWGISAKISPTNVRA